MSDPIGFCGSAKLFFSDRYRKRSEFIPDCLRIMAVSPLQLAKRALVTLLLALARQYDIPAIPINRDSPDKVVLDAFKKVARKVHPDKGGSHNDCLKLNAAREALG